MVIHSHGKVLNVKNAPWYDPMELDKVITMLKILLILGIVMSRQYLQMAVTRKPHSLFFQSYERAHWQTFDEYNGT